MKINNFFSKLFFITTLFILSSCETTNLDQLEDPSAVPQSLTDPILAFNYVQIKLPEFVNSANDFTQQVTRQMAMTGGNTYENAFTPVSFNSNWQTAYDLLHTINIMEPLALQKKYYYPLGASKVIRCYVFATLVDMYGDIPFSEAFQGYGNLYPKYDSSASVYKQILLDIDDAINILSLTGDVTPSTNKDLYYTNKSSWITLAKTIKLKMYNNARLAGADLGVNIATEMSAIITAGDYISDSTKDFAFRYGTTRTNPNSRHPMYNDQYELNGGAYIANYMMWAMTTEKGFAADATSNNDPRTNYYFFRQNADPSQYNHDTFTLPGRARPDAYNDPQFASFYDPTVKAPYVVSNWVTGPDIPARGFWGRDHGDNSGIPPDADKRTVAGVYPIGGAYGSATSVQTSGNKGALGAGIMPIILSSYVHFIKAEAILTLGIAGDPKAEFLAGISESINKSTHIISNYPVLSASQTSALTNNTTFYLNFMGAKYDATPATNKLEIIMKEYYIAAWGNGIEPYNNYRRTGYPSNFQPTLEPVSGAYYSTGLYPQVSVVNNPSAPLNVRTKKVFWDKANITLH